jgi:predicted nucleic acid-binding protein
MTVIVDTTAILVLFDEGKAEHDAIAGIASDVERPLILSPMVMAEADYMLASRFGPGAARSFCGDVANGSFELATWSASDQATVLEVIDSYHGDYVGIADASNVVLADRYRTTELLTLDQRHFRLLRPIWGAEHFTLLPYDVT